MAASKGSKGAGVFRLVAGIGLLGVALSLPLLEWSPGVGRVEAQDPATGPAPRFGDPLPDLTAKERQLFRDGQRAFGEEEDFTDGLGPVFNDISCAACHNVPVTGGGSSVLTTRFGRVRSDGSFDPLIRLGGPVVQRQGITVPAGTVLPDGTVLESDFVFRGEVVPAEANAVARRRATQTFGLGLVDAVPDSTYIALPNSQPLAQRGRPNMVFDPRPPGRTVVGKFGWKAGAANLFFFSGNAYKEEMGITTGPWVRTPDGRSIEEENPPQGDASPLRFNPVASPNDDLGDVQAFTDFMTLLGPPPRGPITDEVLRGERIFSNIGCAICHVPTLTTGPNAIAALDRKDFHPYSDFLIHDMGSLGDGVEEGSGRRTEMRTAPLWGLRVQPFFLHDGRATTVEQAIRMHRGQGQESRDRFVNELTRRQKDALLAFLNSL